MIFLDQWGFLGDLKNKKYTTIIKKITKLSKRSIKLERIHIIEPNIKELKKYIKLDYDFIGYSLDIRFLNSRLNEFKKLRK